MTTATTPAVSREVLEDRWACATTVREVNDEWSKLMWRLDRSLIALQEAVTRREWTGTVATDAAVGMETDGSGDVHHLVHEAIRTTMLDAIERLGVAR